MSKNSCGRRSRVDRSKGKSCLNRSGLSNNNGRNAVTPSAICHIAPQTSVTAVTDVAGPNVRILPGSDAISLELNVKGMSAPNKDFT